MAPVFEKNLFWIQTDNEQMIVLIGFTGKDQGRIFNFRDVLCERIVSVCNLLLYKVEGEPTKMDSVVRFFEKNLKRDVEDFFSKKAPSMISYFIKDKKYKEYEGQKATIQKHIRLEIETSHDHPCLIIHSKIFRRDDLLKLISETAKAVDLLLIQSQKVLKSEEIVLSNRKFKD